MRVIAAGIALVSFCMSVTGCVGSALLLVSSRAPYINKIRVLAGTTDSKGADRGNNRLFLAFISSNSRFSPGIYSMIEIDLAKYAVCLYKVGIDVTGMLNACRNTSIAYIYMDFHMVYLGEQ
jgi:hypothetical protein